MLLHEVMDELSNFVCLILLGRQTLVMLAGLLVLLHFTRLDHHQFLLTKIEANISVLAKPE